ncbi:MGDG synthase family glycosyltransferase [Solihabitans fulvus]|uniref:MGDG synthase family glycosyltransferase n=1 Tax=Solihabitans fulvus TaxID=1892852 RepID=UPI001CB767FF|nr:hypothetical protein [Solihabitans fulvus]
MRGRIAIVSASVGAGHDGAARELAERLEAEGYEVQRHDFLDLLPGWLGRALPRAYEKQLSAVPWTWDWLLGFLQLFPLAARAVTGMFAFAARRSWGVLPADVQCVVSTYPLASHALGRLKRKGRLDAPIVTYLTDMSVHRLWVAKDAEVHLALHPVAAEQAERLNARNVTIVAPAVGPVFRPARNEAERVAARRKFGLPEIGRYALVVAGSWGAGEVEEAAREIALSGGVMPVVVCGRNEALRQRVERAKVGIAFGWIDDMPTLMRACDVVVQNAGGLSSLEAFATDLPVLSYRCLPGHGRTNAKALDRAGLAPWIHTQGQLEVALARLTRDHQDSTAELFSAQDPSTVISDLAKHTESGRSGSAPGTRSRAAAWTARRQWVGRNRAAS